MVPPAFLSKPNFVMKITPKKTRHAGFALIVTLSLMILLTVIAVGLLTLSTISLRSTSQGAAQAIANSNARLALMLAIGDLQKHLGPDQRISADASSFQANSPQPSVVGVWDSHGWLGGTSPVPSASEKASKFRTWLVSTKAPTSATTFSYVDTAPPDFVWLSKPATTGEMANNKTTMQAQKIPLTVGTAKGTMAWMVTDNSTKAQISIAANNSDQIGKNVANRTAGTAPRPDVIDQSLAINDPARLISMKTAALAVGQGDKSAMEKVTGRAPSLTTSSLGLLTNTVFGGLKTDLTPLLESGNASRITDVMGTTPYFTRLDGAPYWRFLRDHYQIYRTKMKWAGTGMPNLRLTSIDMVGGSTGVYPQPTKPVLLPVIAKLQIMFSMVSHHAHISDRVAAFNSFGVPKGNEYHATPHLVYDPIITLYNPYDVALELNQLRIRVSDPPVGFQFQKIDKAAGTSPWYRSEFANGDYHGLPNFQIAHEKPPTTVRKTFTYLLRERRPGADGNPGASIKLKPGEVRVFMAWVEKNWTWGMETAGGYSGRSFFDHDYGRNMGNVDLRTGEQRGVEAVPGLDWRAGLQTDHMSYGSGRPANSKYSWEAPPLGAGWLSMKLTDDVVVNCKPKRFAPGTQTQNPDFRVDLMAGNPPVTPADSDLMRTYEFRMGDPAVEMMVPGATSDKITRTFNNEDILQTPSDQTAGGKTPFAIFTMSAKTTKDDTDDSKAWAFGNMVTEGGIQTSTLIGNAAQSYDLSLRPVTSFTQFPGVEYDDAQQRGYFGAKATAADGVSLVPMYRLPLTPAASLGDWIGSNLVTSSQFPRVNYALGNSFANPLIPSSDISMQSPMGNARALDHSYLMNASLWDSVFFSSATNYNYTGSIISPARGKNEVISDFFTGKDRMLNSRLIPYVSGSDAESLANTYSGKSEIEFAKSFAGNALIEGAFNVNSASVDAWRAVLSSLRESSVVGYTNKIYPVGDKTAFVRTGLPIAGSADDTNPENTVEADGQIRWAGFRTLTDDQIEDLAEAIVQEIRERNDEDDAPALCLADFINRRPGSASSVHALKGILQTAIDKIGINQSFHQDYSRSISGSGLPAYRTNGLSNKDALDGPTGDGAAPMLTQGDLLTGLAPIITARGDTFTIRSYGESKATNGTVLARAWCEATVQRIPDYVDATNPADFDIGKPADGDIMNSGLTLANKLFGRRFVVTSFRWLNSSEI